MTKQDFSDVQIGKSMVLYRAGEQRMMELIRSLSLERVCCLLQRWSIFFFFPFLSSFLILIVYCLINNHLIIIFYHLLCYINTFFSKTQ